MGPTAVGRYRLVACYLVRAARFQRSTASEGITNPTFLRISPIDYLYSSQVEINPAGAWPHCREERSWWLSCWALWSKSFPSATWPTATARPARAAPSPMSEHLREIERLQRRKLEQERREKQQLQGRLHEAQKRTEKTTLEEYLRD